jgi:hypothetical protein
MRLAGSSDQKLINLFVLQVFRLTKLLPILATGNNPAQRRRVIFLPFRFNLLCSGFQPLVSQNQVPASRIQIANSSFNTCLPSLLIKIIPLIQYVHIKQRPLYISCLYIIHFCIVSDYLMKLKPVLKVKPNT